MAQWSSTGATALSTAQSKFGGSSLGLSTSQGLTANIPRFYSLTDFTFEGFFRFNALGTSNVMFSTHTGYGSAAGVDGLCLYTNSVNILLWLNGASVSGFAVAHGMSINTWYHIALVRSGSTLYLFKDGALLRTVTGTGNVNLSRMHIGTDPNTINGLGTLYMDGYIDEVRLTAAARYTSAFTAPSAEFTLVGDSEAANVFGLLHFNGSNGDKVFTDEITTSYFPGLTLNHESGIRSADMGPTLSSWGSPLSVGALRRLRRINMGTGDSIAVSMADASRTNHFLEGIAIKDSLPLPNTKIVLRGNGESWLDGFTTKDDGKFIFHELTGISNFYRAVATPPGAVDHNEIVWSRLTAVPYEITTAGDFTQNTTTSEVDGTVVITSGLEPFSISHIDGSLPPSTTLEIDGRNITIDGVTTFTGSYSFTLVVTNALKSYTRLIELTPPGTQGMGRVIGADGAGLALEYLSEATSAWRYWRLTLSSPYGGGTNYLAYSEVAFATSVGGANAATGGTPTASSTYSGYPVSNLYDGNLSNEWYTAGLIAPGSTEWLKYDFGSAIAIAEVRVRPSVAGPTLYFPSSIAVHGSNDNSTWTFVKTLTPGAPVASTWQAFTL